MVLCYKADYSYKIVESNAIWDDEEYYFGVWSFSERSIHSTRVRRIIRKISKYL